MDLAALLGQWLVDRFPGLPSHLLQQGVASKSSERLLSTVLSDRETEELRALLDMPKRNGQRVPTIFLPGFMGSILASTCGISATLWYSPTLLANGHLNLLDMADDGLADASPEVDIQPIGIEKLSYLKSILGLAHATRLYEFPYDWRQSIERTAERLRQSIKRWSEHAEDRRFVLVGHSMGGLVAWTFAAKWPDECARYVEQIITIGTPLRGAATPALALAGHTNTTRLIEKLHPQNKVRRLAMSWPASYQLLPPPRDCFDAERDYPYNWDVYDARAWGLPGLRQDWLDHAEAWHRRLAVAEIPVPMTQIAGCHQRTMTDVYLPDERDAQGLASWQDSTAKFHDSGEDSGDDSVPLWSARHEQLTTYFIQEHHQLLPANGEVVQAVIDLTQGQTPELPTELPDPRGILHSIKTVPIVQQAAELRKRIESGHATPEDLISLLLHRG